MYILTVNCGSSSLKLDVIDTQTQQCVTELKAERLPEERDITLNGKTLTYTGELLFPSILTFCLEAVKKDLADKTISGIGHRVVHGGDKYYQPVLIDEQVTKTIEDLIDLAPLHNPANLSGIKAAQQVFPNFPNTAVFDSGFHQTLPSRAKQYAIDKEIAKKYNIKRYGFHGTSHRYVAQKAADWLKQDMKNLKTKSILLSLSRKDNVLLSKVLIS